MGKYFNVEVKPTMPTVAVGQHADFGNSDLVFDWYGFDVPKGANRLIGVTMEIRSAGDAGASVQKPAMELLFAKDIVGSASAASPGKSSPTSLGTINSATSATNGPKGEIIGAVEMAVTGYTAGLDGTSICTTGRTPQDALGLVLEGVPDSGTNVGYDKIYIAGILDASTTLDLESLTRINDGTLDEDSFTVNGTDPRLFLAVGDTIAITTTADTSVQKSMGTIKSMTQTNITLETTTENAVVNDDFIYNVNPIKFILHFER